MKHYTSKLRNYDDLSNLETFGFRGEALSSLCALSDFRIITAQAHEAPKATKLEFEHSGKLKSTSVVAGTRGTLVSVEKLFHNLPVRRRELEKNIKREYGKVLGLLQAYACVSTNVRFSVKSLMGKGKSAVVFATKSNATTKENIANIYGAKSISALMPLDLELEFEPSRPLGRLSKRSNGDESREPNKIFVSGHISRPIFGEGRTTPDRQAFFVNGRPCGLPQIAKAFNEVYKSFNVSQSPFIFADFRMDTSAYDVNVSPDKRTILLHDAAALIESLKENLVSLFERQEHTVPQSQLYTPKTPAYRQLTISREGTGRSDESPSNESPLASSSITRRSTEKTRGKDEDEDLSEQETPDQRPAFVSMLASKGLTRLGSSPNVARAVRSTAIPTPKTDLETASEEPEPAQENQASESVASDINDPDPQPQQSELPPGQISPQQSSPVPPPATAEPPIPSISSASPMKSQPHQESIVQTAYDRMRPKRPAPQVATITIGDKTTTTLVGTPSAAKRVKIASPTRKAGKGKSAREARARERQRSFGASLRAFQAPGTQADQDDEEEGLGEEAEDEMDEDVSEDPEDEIEDVSEEEDEHENGSFVDSQAEQANASSDEEASGDEELFLKDNEEIEVGRDAPKTPVRASNQVGEVREEDDSGSEEEKEEQAEDIDMEASDDEYIDEATKQQRDEAKIAQLIRQAEEKASMPTAEQLRRANSALKGGTRKDATTRLLAELDGSIDRIEAQMRYMQEAMHCRSGHEPSDTRDAPAGNPAPTAEERLSLSISKTDFAKMRIVGQFNLGFILATRSSASNTPSQSQDDLFIIDQHASDEKYNFERLQATTVVQNQRLVRPKTLDLTAVEEEIVMENLTALEKNGFLVDMDLSGDEPIGHRCKLTSLPLSKEVVFDSRDLEELIALLSESSSTTTGTETLASSYLPSTSTMAIPRPSKVRRMFAMRACRSSIMVGRTLTKAQMEKVVVHMGQIEQPWNCPHGRPTMRHLCDLGEFVGSWGEREEDDRDMQVWRRFVKK